MLVRHKRGVNSLAIAEIVIATPRAAADRNGWVKLPHEYDYPLI